MLFHRLLVLQMKDPDHSFPVAYQFGNRLTENLEGHVPFVAMMFQGLREHIVNLPIRFQGFEIVVQFCEGREAHLLCVLF